MSNRSDLCEARGLLEDLEQRLGAIEARVAIRNAAHEISRARSMIRASSEFVTRALGQPVDALLGGDSQ